jgi:acetyltransferase
MEQIIDYARREGLERIEGQVLSENTTMLRMCGELGFHLEHDPDDPGVMVATLSLSA